MWKTLRILAGELTLLFWFSSAILQLYYVDHRPSKYSADAGRIYPINEHGMVVYLTSFEHYLLYALMALAAIFFASFVAIHFYGVKTGAWGMFETKAKKHDNADVDDP